MARAPAAAGQKTGATAKLLCNNDTPDWFNWYKSTLEGSHMKIKLLAVALFASAALVPSLEAGNHHGSGGGGAAFAAHPGMARSAGPSFSSMPMRSFSGNRMIYSGQRFSYGMRSPGVTQFRSRPLNSNFSGRKFTGGGVATNRINQFGNNQRFVHNRNGFASSNAAIGNRMTGSGQIRNGNRLAPNWHNHVVAQHSANWHSNWSHNHDHSWHGHRWCFIGGSWFAFDVGFYPWWPWWWDYPYYYGYGYGYPYYYGYYPNGYGYGYGYNDPGVYNGQPAYQQGEEDQPGYQNGYNDQSANSTVAAAQDRLSRDGFYNGQIDGVLGPETRHALVRFQTKHGLRISGELTTETLDALGLRQYANSGVN